MRISRFAKERRNRKARSNVRFGAAAAFIAEVSQPSSTIVRDRLEADTIQKGKQMTSTAWLLLALGIAMLCLDAYAVRKVYSSEIYEKRQFWAQTALILLVPLVGASLAIYLCRDNVPLFQKPPVDHVRDIDGTCSDVDYQG